MLSQEILEKIDGQTMFAKRHPQSPSPQTY